MDEQKPLYPDFDHDKPNKLVAKMMPDSDVKPKNIPDKVLNPEHWKYYDDNLDMIKEVPAAHTFGSNLTLEERLKTDLERKQKEEFDHRNYKEADMTTYDPFVKNTKIPFDFGIRADRFNFEDDQDLDKEGDVLILDGDKAKKRIPGFDIDKMTKRFDDF